MLVALALAATPDPEAVIDGPLSGIVGDSLVFSAEHSLNASSLKWRIEPKDTQGFFVVDGGKRAIFSNRTPGDYLIILAVGNEGGVDIDTHKVHLTAGAVAQAGLTTAAVAAPPVVGTGDVKIEVRNWMAEVRSPTRDAEARMLAGSFREAVTLIDMGNITTREELIEATQKMSEQALNGAYLTWKPWFQRLLKYLNNASNAGRLQDLAAHRRIWVRIATGLDPVGSTREN